jgi:hypothetical protein
MYPYKKLSPWAIARSSLVKGESLLNFISIAYSP